MKVLLAEDDKPIAEPLVDGRRVTHAGPPQPALGPLSIDPRVREATLYGIPLTLTAKEYQLLALLADDPGAVLDRRRILETVWGANFFGTGKTLDFHVAALRRKLGDPRWIENRRGVGFRLVVPPDAS